MQFVHAMASGAPDLQCRRSADGVLHVHVVFSELRSPALPAPAKLATQRLSPLFVCSG
jgi:hypothetical protein